MLPDLISWCLHKHMCSYGNPEYRFMFYPATWITSCCIILPCLSNWGVHTPLTYGICCLVCMRPHFVYSNNKWKTLALGSAMWRPLANGMFVDKMQARVRKVFVQQRLPSCTSAIVWPVCWSQEKDKWQGAKLSQLICRLWERSKVI